MQLLKTSAAILATVLVFTACDSSGSVTTLSGEAEDTVTALVTEVQEAAADLEDKVSNSTVADNLSDAWAAVETNVDEVVAAVAAGSTDLEDEFEDELDTFEDNLDELGDEAGDELTTAWQTFRTAFESLVDEIS
ncbi:MAG: hypothetical protein HKN07_12310 [Acidimicrobiia bacterium]|nr:hypothetical protein [Acidimicrobiia bacterium]NNF65022.1 hypothetical protein [Acidimicrobiia bacterium]